MEIPRDIADCWVDISLLPFWLSGGIRGLLSKKRCLGLKVYLVSVLYVQMDSWSRILSLTILNSCRHSHSGGILFHKYINMIVDYTARYHHIWFQAFSKHFAAMLLWNPTVFFFVYFIHIIILFILLFYSFFKPFIFSWKDLRSFSSDLFVTKCFIWFKMLTHFICTRYIFSCF